MIRITAAIVLALLATTAHAAECAAPPASVAKAVTNKPYAQARQILFSKGFFPERQNQIDERIVQTGYFESDFCMSGGCSFIWSKDGKRYEFWSRFNYGTLGKTTVNCP